MFSHFEITSDFFDSAGDRDFTDLSDEKDVRGGLDYYFPKGSNRFWLNVMKKNYDEESMDLLGMRNCPGEWAVAYHRTSFDNLTSI